MGRHRVIGLGHFRDAVHQDHHVPLLLHQPQRPFQRQLADLGQGFRRFIHGRADHLALDRLAHLGHILGPLIQQQHQQLGFQIPIANGRGQALEQRRFPGPGRGHHQRPLAKAHGSHQIHHPQQDIRARPGHQRHFPLRIQGGELLKAQALGSFFGGLTIDFGDIQQCAGPVALPLGPGFAGHEIAGAQVKAANLRVGYINIVFPGAIIADAQEAVAIGMHLQHTLAIAAFAGHEHISHGRAAARGSVLMIIGRLPGRAIFLGSRGRIIRPRGVILPGRGIIRCVRPVIRRPVLPFRLLGAKAGG